MGIEIIPINFKNGMGYDLRITSNFVTVQDYLDTLNGAILQINFNRLWNEGGSCYGCDLCCKERIPLTLIDAYKLSGDARVINGWPEYVKMTAAERLAAFIKRYCHVFVNGEVVDISLRLNEDGTCPFLDNNLRICRVYQNRPLVCQTFICSPLSKRAARLREMIVNAGEDKLVNWWLSYAEKNEIRVWFNEADNPQISLENWECLHLTDIRDYSSVNLIEIVTPVLWKMLKS